MDNPKMDASRTWTKSDNSLPLSLCALYGEIKKEKKLRSSEPTTKKVRERV